MGASDYMVGDPGRYAVPQVGQQLGQALADLPDAYMKGREMKRTRAMQDMFAGGMPQKEDGSPDWTAALHKYLQEGAKIGGGQFIGQYVTQVLDEEAGRNAAAISRGEPVGPSTFFGAPPSQAGSAAPPSQSQGGAQGQQQPAAQPQKSGPRFRQLAASYRLGKDAIDSLGRTLKIDPEMVLSPQEVIAVRRAIEEELPKQGRGAPSEVADDGTNAGSRPPFMGGGTSGARAPAGGVAPNAVAQAGGGTANVDAAGPPQGAGASFSDRFTAYNDFAKPGGLRPTPVGTEAEAKLKELSAADKEAAAAYWSKRNPTGSKDLMEQATALRKRASEIRESLGAYNKPTPEMMNAEASGFKSPNEAKAAGKFGEDIAGAKAKGVATRIEGIKPAQDSIQVLDEMMNAFRAGGTNISTGPGAREWLKVKQAVNNQIPGFFKGVPEAEEVDKLNSYLASAVAKAMTPRPTQYEFKAFQQQTPGLLQSREGSAVLADILRQTKMQELELGRIADKFKIGEGKSWSEVEEKYFKDHPIISPQTHKPIDAKKAADGKWYRPDPDRPGKFLAER